jgi:hypothetical protein
MTSQLDLILLPLIGYGKPDRQMLPGLHTAKPPRRAARGRSRDQLILYLTQAGNAPLSDDQIKQLLARLAPTYFKTPGSVTAAQRAVAEALNQYLLDRNLRNTSSGQQSIGMLVQLVLRGNRLWVAQSGPAHAFVVASDHSQHLYDLTLSGRGLGLSRTTPVRFSQVTLNLNDALVLTPQPPPGWTSATLQNAYNRGPGNLRRYLLSQTSPHLDAVLVQAQKGNQRIHLLRPVRAQRPRTGSPEPEQSMDVDGSEEEMAGKLQVSASIEEAVESRPQPAIPKPRPASAARPGQPARTAVPTDATSTSPAPAVDRIPTGREKSRRFSLPRPNLGPLSKALAVIGRAFGNTGQQVGNAFGSLFKEMLPDAGIFALPASTMAFVAIAVPVIVVTIASIVYFQRGSADQHEIHLAQAVQSAQQAQSLEDPQELRLAWDLTLRYLDQAEYYQTSEQSESLRTQAQDALDTLNGVERLEYQSALTTPLDADALISRMVTVENDLYLLNSAEGVVARATLTNQGYTLDPTFQCGPGPFGGYIVGAIVDIAPLAADNSNRATVLGIDANGNLLYCIPGEAPLALPMAPPDTNWGSPVGVVQDSGDLYILDPLTNAVWIYRGIDVTRQPRLFFSEEIPTMHDVIDLSVNRNDLYLLHEDGQMTTCTYSGLIESPTRCEDPAIYTDPRPGLEDGITIQDAQLTEIKFMPPPDPSLYLLDPQKKAIYHLSVRLTLQRQYQAFNDLPESPATSFAIDRANRAVFLSLGNQVYYANLP